jgi:hypothetical protein
VVRCLVKHRENVNFTFTVTFVCFAESHVLFHVLFFLYKKSDEAFKKPIKLNFGRSDPITYQRTGFTLITCWLILFVCLFVCLYNE